MRLRPETLKKYVELARPILAEKAKKNKIELFGTCIAILVLFFAASFWDELSKNNVITILVVSIGVASLGFSIFFALRTNLLYHSRVADANIYSYTLQTNTSDDTCGKIARNWYWNSEKNREHAEVRAYSANFCSYSIIILLIGILVAIKWEQQHYWLYPFEASVVFIIIAFVISRSKRPNICRPLLIAKFPIDPKLPRWIEKDFIANHDWLKTPVEWEDDC